jgi:hypothetical protein
MPVSRAPTDAHPERIPAYSYRESGPSWVQWAGYVLYGAGILSCVFPMIPVLREAVPVLTTAVVRLVLCYGAPLACVVGLVLIGSHPYRGEPWWKRALVGVALWSVPATMAYGVYLLNEVHRIYGAD